VCQYNRVWIDMIRAVLNTSLAVMIEASQNLDGNWESININKAWDRPKPLKKAQAFIWHQALMRHCLFSSKEKTKSIVHYDVSPAFAKIQFYGSQPDNHPKNFRKGLLPCINFCLASLKLWHESLVSRNGAAFVRNPKQVFGLALVLKKKYFVTSGNT